MAKVIPKGAAQVVLWRDHQQHIVFMVSEDSGQKAQQAFLNGDKHLLLTSWPDATGTSNTTLIDCTKLTGVSVEVNSIQLVV